MMLHLHFWGTEEDGARFRALTATRLSFALFAAGSLCLPATARSPIPVAQEYILSDPVGQAGDRFGSSVAVSGHTIVVGAPGKCGETGAALIFERANDQLGWVLTDELFPPAEDCVGPCRFGEAVDIQPNRIAVAAERLDHVGGGITAGVFIYDRTSAGWELTAALQPEGNSTTEIHGRSVALGPGAVVLGSDGGDNFFIFDESEPDWTYCPNGVCAEYHWHYGPEEIGFSVDFAAGFIISGAPHLSGVTGSGSSHPFSWGGSTIAPHNDGYSPPEDNGQEHFGYAVAARWTELVVSGAPSYDGAYVDQGRVYVHDFGGPHVATLESPMPGTATGFGKSVAIEGDLIAAGEPGLSGGGRVQLFSSASGAWSWIECLEPGVPEDVPGEFAIDVELTTSGDVVAGSPLSLVNGISTGAVHVFERCVEGDTDGDLVADDCDRCPLDPMKVLPGDCGCGTPDVDADGNGIVDCLDVDPIFVDVNSPAGSNGDGTSWSAAYDDLQVALNAAVPSDQIWVAGGTYRPTDGSDRTVAFRLRSGVEVYGGFEGFEIALDQRNHDPETNGTILSGDIGVAGDPSDNSYHVVEGCDPLVADSWVDSSALLDGFTIRDGQATGIGFNNSRGGGFFIKIESTTGVGPTIRNCYFTNNEAKLGGALFMNGGGCGDTTWTVERCIFRANHATESGGAAYHNSPDGCFQFLACVFEGNWTGDQGSLGGGGAVYSNEAKQTYIHCLFRNNLAYNGGAIMNGTKGDITVVGSVLVENNAVNNGGGIHLDHWNETNELIVNSIFWANTAGVGSLEREQIGQSAEPPAGDEKPDVHFCCVEGWTGMINPDGVGNTAADPLFADLSAGVLTLLPGSPAVDAGTDTLDGLPLDSEPLETLLPPLPPEDLARRARILDDPDAPDTGIGHCTVIDMGPYERGPSTTSYCTSKTTAAGCIPTISSEGQAALSGLDDLVITASDVPGQTSGVLLWSLDGNPPPGTSSAGAPFGASRVGTTVCIASPQPIPAPTSGGTAGECDGTFAQPLAHEWLWANGVVAGRTLRVQYLFADPGHPDGSGLGHTDALELLIWP